MHDSNYSFNLHPNKCTQGLRHYPFAINLDKCVESYKTLEDLSSRACIPNKTENLNLRDFNMITEINESKTLTKRESCKCECKFDGRKCNENQKWNDHKCC